MEKGLNVDNWSLKAIIIGIISVIQECGLLLEHSEFKVFERVLLKE